MEYFLGAFKKYADFTGRARRQEYWMYTLFYIIIYVALSVVGYVIHTGLLAIVFSLACLVPSISIAARRLHDTSRSGWWQLIALIPLIGAIILIVFWRKTAMQTMNTAQILKPLLNNF